MTDKIIEDTLEELLDLSYAEEESPRFTSEKKIKLEQLKQQFRDRQKALEELPKMKVELQASREFGDKITLENANMIDYIQKLKAEIEELKNQAKKQNECSHYNGEEIDPSLDEKWRRCVDCGHIDKSYDLTRILQQENNQLKQLKERIEREIKPHLILCNVVDCFSVEHNIERQLLKDDTQ